MEEIIIPSYLRMQLPDQQAYELKLIKTPEKIETDKIKAYILMGAFGTLITILTILYVADRYKKNTKNN